MAWKTVGNIKGPPGNDSMVTGPPGPQGEIGPPGPPSTVPGPQGEIGPPGPGTPFVVLTQEEYDALTDRDLLTVYIVTELGTPSSSTVTATLSGAGVLSAATTAKIPVPTTLAGSGVLSATATSGVTVPTPVSSFDWHEGSGATTTSLVSAHTLSVPNWTEHNGTGAIGPSGTVTTWTWAVDFTLTSASGDVTLCSTESPYFFLNFDAGRPGPYPDQTTATFPLGTPAMLTVVVIPTLCLVYIDGVQEGSFAGSYSMNPASFKIMVDSHPPGVVHSLRYWDSALTAPQVAAL